MRALAAALTVALAYGVASDLRAQLVIGDIYNNDPAEQSPPNSPVGDGKTWPDGRAVAPPDQSYVVPFDQAAAADGYEGPPMPDDPSADPGWSLKSVYPHHWFPPLVTRLGFRHSSADGRNVGLGGPLVGTSWLNRPYYIGGEFGSLWIMRRVENSVSRDTDVYGGLYVGWDWDFYWGSELRFDWSTPELINSEDVDATRADSLFAWSYNLMYYPWGDSRFRPYWHWGIGGAHFDYPTDDGHRNDETLWTFPIGVGLKYPLERWLAARAEFSDLISIGEGGIPTMNNLTLTLGLELRYGIHPRSYWPWNPSRHMW